jgi:acyl-CoA thioesterase
MASDAFYVRRDDGSFDATGATVGPWDGKLQHGGPPAALLATAIEAMSPRLGVRVAHFALEFLGPVPVAPMRLATQVVRPGKKIELVSATASVGDRVVLKATAWRLSTQAEKNPPRNFEDMPAPKPAEAETRLFYGVPSFGYGESLEWRFTSGGFHELGPAAVWSKLRVAIVRGEPVSALARALAMVDSANGISAELDVRKFLFVPVNLTVSIDRAPLGEWVGMSAKTRLASEGVGTTHARLFDETGYLGESLQTLFVEPR